MLRILIRTAITGSLVALTACSGGGDDTFGFLEGTASTVDPACTIVLATPSQGGNLRIASSSVTPTQIVIVTNDDSCEVSYALNGTTVATGPSLNLSASSLNVGANTLVATVANSVGSQTITWNALRNTAPTCANPVPATTGTVFSENTPTTFTTDFADADSDTVSVTWRVDGNAQPTLFTPSATATTKSAIFQGNSTIVGARVISALLSDGYDTTSCSWNVTINDSNVAEVDNCQPSGSSAGSPIVLYEGTATPITLSGDATGTGITRQWKIQAPAAGTYSNIAGQTGPTLSLTQTIAPPAVGNYRITLTAVDTYANTAECATPFFIRSNDAPSFAGSPSPATNAVGSPIKYNAGSTRTLSAGTSVTDVNGDTILYTWSIDGTDVNTASATPTSTDARLTISTLNPLEATYDATAAANGPGFHTIRVRISDGYEFDTKTWYIQPNYLSDACNALDPGEICTLVGSPSVGDGLNPTLSANLSRLRFRPRHFAKHVVGGVTNIAFTDATNHLVWYWNRTNGALDFFGKRIPANSLRVVLGSGIASIGNAASLITASSPGKVNPTKINTPVGLAINTTNATDPVMYVALNGNHRVVAIDNSGVTPFFLGPTANSTGTANGKVLDSVAGAQCNNPYGVDYYAATDSLYVACNGNHSIRVVPGISTLSAATESTMIVKASTGTTTVNGTIGAAGTATSYSPRMLRVDQSNGNVFWLDGCTTSGGFRGGTVRIYNYAGIASYGSRTGLVSGAVDQVTGWTGAADCNAVGGSDLTATAATAQANARINNGVDIDLMPSGLLYTDATTRRVLYLNASGSADSTTFASAWLGGSIPAQSIVKVNGCESNGTAGTCLNSLNENASGIAARNVEPYGILYLSSGVTTSTNGVPVLLWADHWQARIRELRLGSGQVTTAAPAGNLGYQRYGQGGGATPVTGTAYPANVTLYSPTGLAIDSTNKILYIAEYNARHVAQISLNTGEVTSTIGGGASYSENQGRSNVLLGNLTALIHTDVVNTFPVPKPTLPRNLIYLDGITTAGVGQPCMLRALQLGSGSNSVFGTTLNSSDTVQSILGSISSGCTAVATGTNASTFTASAGSAMNVPLTAHSDQGGGVFRSVAIGVDSANSPVIFVVLPEKACVVRVTQNGAVEPVVGTCTGTTGNGGSPAANVSPLANQLAIPRGIAVDPLKPQNFFLLDQGGTTAIGSIKYVNLSSSCVGPGAGCEGVGVNNNYFGQSIAAGKIQTLRNVTGTPYLNSLAVNSTKLCYTGGRINTSNSGEHALVCLARSSGATSLYCGGDSAEYPNRDGSPLSDIPLYESDGVTESYGYHEGKACSTNAASNLGDVLLSGPAGIVFDADGNLYVADTQNHIVRMIKAW